MKPTTLWGTAKNSRKHRWANLTLLEERRDPLMLTNKLTGEVYEADSHGPLMWRLACDCGHEFEIPFDDFPGRRIARDCNRDECPYTQERRGRRQPRERKLNVARGRPVTVGGVTYSVYVPKDLGEQVQKYSAHRNISFSAAITELAQAGLADKIANDESFIL